MCQLDPNCKLLETRKCVKHPHIKCICQFTKNNKELKTCKTCRDSRIKSNIKNKESIKNSRKNKIIEIKEYNKQHTKDKMCVSCWRISPLEYFASSTWNNDPKKLNKSCRICRMNVEKSRKPEFEMLKNIMKDFLILNGNCCKNNTEFCDDVLQFDHIIPLSQDNDPKNKVENITYYPYWATRPIEEFRDEFKKIQILCYGCHRLKSYKERKITNRQMKPTILKKKNMVIEYKLSFYYVLVVVEEK